MTGQDIMTGIWLIVAIALIVVALLLAVVRRGKTMSAIYDKSRWLLVTCNLLIAIDILVHTIACGNETSSTISLLVNLACLVAIIPLYHFALVNILRDSKENKPQPQETLPEHPEPPPHDTPPPSDTNESAVSVERWVVERHFTAPDITVDKALEQMGISITALNYYLEQHTEAGSFRKWLAYLRVEEAKRLMLEHPEYAFQAIAEACGYSNNASLSRSFKAQEGMPPSEWLAKQQNPKHH